MTTTSGPVARTGRPGVVRVLGPGDEGRLDRLVSADPVRHCFAASRADAGLRRADFGGQVWGYEVGGEITSALLVGANMVPVETDSTARLAFADHAIRQGRRSSSIVGPAEEVLDLWRLLAPMWGPARDVRPDQPLMSASHPATCPADPLVRPAGLDELDVMFPACVDMFTEEVGVSPLAGGAGPAYRRRVAELIRTGRSLARFDGGEPIFKAELGAVSARACQIQGVWVRPDRRGQGLASSGMSAVVDYARRMAPAVSLYVNSYNTPALAAYRRAGFVPVETFATVLF